MTPEKYRKIKAICNRLNTLTEKCEEIQLRLENKELLSDVLDNINVELSLKLLRRDGVRS